jgi:hypothetical protein
MGETPHTSTEVVCPCCEARLTIDLSLGVVLHHEPPPKASSVTDLKEGGRGGAQDAIGPTGRSV